MWSQNVFQTETTVLLAGRNTFVLTYLHLNDSICWSEFKMIFHFLFSFWRLWVTDYSWKNISGVTMNRHEPSRTVLFVPGSQVLKLTCHLSWLNNSSQTNHLSDKKGRDGEDYVTANE